MLLAGHHCNAQLDRFDMATMYQPGSPVLTHPHRPPTPTRSPPQDPTLLDLGLLDQPLLLGRPRHRHQRVQVPRVEGRPCGPPAARRGRGGGDPGQLWVLQRGVVDLGGRRLPAGAVRGAERAAVLCAGQGDRRDAPCAGGGGAPGFVGRVVGEGCGDDCCLYSLFSSCSSLDLPHT